ncbi:MAG: hypothetical protein IH983_03105 [Planctomycetes bacterium]|nr:hypothetical protein [Planctomycetota bacterium]
MPTLTTSADASRIRVLVNIEVDCAVELRIAFHPPPGQWVNRIRQRRPMKKLILDMDSSVSETYGRRERIS